MPDLNLAPINPAAFMANPLIQSLAHQRRWTISDKQKRPLSITSYLKTGMWHNFKTSTDLTTLDTLAQQPDFTYTNRAYRLMAQYNHLMLIDIEPKASTKIRQALLALPVAYAESSTHGGLHLLLPVPESIVTANNAYIFDLVAVKGPDKNFEMLLNNHFVTFTQRVIPTAPVDYDQDDVQAKITQFLNQLVTFDEAAHDRQAIASANQADEPDWLADLDDQTPTDDEQLLLNLLKPQKARIQTTTPADYDNDTSRYEIGIASKCMYAVYNTFTIRFKNPFIDSLLSEKLVDLNNDETKMALAYWLFVDIVPYRAKHDEYRQGLPWLVYVMNNAFSAIGPKLIDHAEKNGEKYVHSH